MKHFTTFEDFSKAFVNEDFQLDTSVEVEDEKFYLRGKSTTNIIEILISQKKPIVVYTNEGFDQQIVCFWNSKGNSIVPCGVFLTNQKLTKPEIVAEMDGEKITLRADQLIGDTATVKFTSFSSPRELKGKVDTGATICSLHADNYKINGNTVTFTCTPLGPNAVTIPLKTQNAVKSPDGGTHYRPVVELNVKINGKLLNNILFNLNDRGNMDEPVLLGQNLLQAGKFFVDPTRSESVEIAFDEIEKLIEELDLKSFDENNLSPIHDIYQQMLESNINFRDLVRHIKSEVIKTDLEG